MGESKQELPLFNAIASRYFHGNQNCGEARHPPESYLVPPAIIVVAATIQPKKWALAPCPKRFQQADSLRPPLVTCAHPRQS